MASLERTAYPRFPRTLTLKDLQTSFTPTAEEIHWVNGKARGAEMRAALGTLLKCFQYLHYFPSVESVPPEVVQHVCATLGLPQSSQITYWGNLTATMYRHHKAIRNCWAFEPTMNATPESL